MLHVPCGRRCAKLRSPKVNPDVRRSRTRAGAYDGPLEWFRLPKAFARRRKAWNGTRSDNPMGQMMKKKNAGVQHEDFSG
ncbi:hypothetical protein ACLOJK_024296, partial [Asimina triloba]